MAQQFISLIKFRRGSNENGLREATTFQEGEPVFEIDTQRTFIGTGSTAIGEKNTVLMGNKVFYDNGQITDTESFTVTGAYGNDILYKNNKLWIKASDDRSNSAWIDVYPKLENGKLKYNENNEITIEDSAITYTAGAGINIFNNTISLKIDGLSPLTINTDSELSIRTGGIGYNYIDKNSFSQSVFLFDDTNSLISLKLNSSYFNVTSSGITIIDVPREPVENVFKSFINLSENSILEFNSDAELTLSDNIKKLNDDKTNLIGAKIGVDNIGIVNDNVDTAYNGTLEEDVAWTGNTRKTIRVYSDNYSPTAAEIAAHGTDTYSTLIKSAGFITLDKGTTAGGKLYKKYAVPVFELPGEPEIICSTNMGGALYDTTYYFGKNLAGARLINSSTLPAKIGKINQFSEFDDISDEYHYIGITNNSGIFSIKTISGNFDVTQDLSYDGEAAPFIARYKEESQLYTVKVYFTDRISEATYNDMTIEVFTVDPVSGEPRSEKTLLRSDCAINTVTLEQNGVKLAAVSNTITFSLHNNDDIDHLIVTIKDGDFYTKTYVLSKEEGTLLNTWK